MNEHPFMVPCTDPAVLNGEATLEAKLRDLYNRQWRLRVLLEATREELDGVNREVLRTQDEACATPAGEEEYWQSQTRIWGEDPRAILKDIEECRKNPPQPIEELLAELESAG